jgi:hypothetical protein
MMRGNGRARVGLRVCRSIVIVRITITAVEAVMNGRSSSIRTQAFAGGAHVNVIIMLRKSVAQVVGRTAAQAEASIIVMGSIIMLRRNIDTSSSAVRKYGRFHVSSIIVVTIAVVRIAWVISGVLITIVVTVTTSMSRISRTVTNALGSLYFHRTSWTLY